MTKTQGDLLAEELRVAVAELPWNWLGYLELEDVAVKVGAPGVRCNWQADGTVKLENSATREVLAHLRVTVSVEEVK